MRWSEQRLFFNETFDWSRRGLTINAEFIEHFWTPDITVIDLVRYLLTNIVTIADLFSFSNPGVTGKAASLELLRDHSLNYRLR